MILSNNKFDKMELKRITSCSKPKYIFIDAGSIIGVDQEENIRNELIMRSRVIYMKDLEGNISTPSYNQITPEMEELDKFQKENIPYKYGLIILENSSLSDIDVVLRCVHDYNPYAGKFDFYNLSKIKIYKLTDKNQILYCRF